MKGGNVRALRQHHSGAKIIIDKHSGVEHRAIDKGHGGYRQSRSLDRVGHHRESYRMQCTYNILSRSSLPGSDLSCTRPFNFGGDVVDRQAGTSDKEAAYRRNASGEKDNYRFSDIADLYMLTAKE